MSSFDSSKNFAEALERLLARHKSHLIKQGALLAGATATAMTGVVGCSADGTFNPEGEPGIESELPGAEGKNDWAQSEGQRNTDEVRFVGENWHRYYDCGGRGGCLSIDVFVKVLVQRHEGANLDRKRVGVVYKTMEGAERTETGTYFGDRDGMEEWHIRIPRRSYDSGIIMINAWYQDGQGHTFFDDNDGELHALAYNGNYTVVQQIWNDTHITVGDDGVQGTITAVLADLDYDKDVRLVYTTDNWATTHEAKIGNGNNEWHWVSDEIWLGHERWEINLDIPGSVDEFQYALVYKHGVVRTARNYDFWDNNGGHNYVVRRGSVP